MVNEIYEFLDKIHSIINQGTIWFSFDDREAVIIVWYPEKDYVIREAVDYYRIMSSHSTTNHAFAVSVAEEMIAKYRQKSKDDTRNKFP